MMPFRVKPNKFSDYVLTNDFRAFQRLSLGYVNGEPLSFDGFVAKKEQGDLDE